MYQQACRPLATAAASWQLPQSFFWDQLRTALDMGPWILVAYTTYVAGDKFSMLLAPFAEE